MGPGEVLGRLSRDEGELPREHAGRDNLRKGLCVFARRVAAACDAEEAQALGLGLNRGAAPDRAERERGERDRDVRPARDRVHGRDREQSLDHVGRVLAAGDEEGRDRHSPRAR